MNAGLGRSRNAAHSILSALCAAAVAVLVYTAIGSCWVGLAGHPAHVLMLGGKSWNWLGAEAPFFAKLALNSESETLTALFGLMGAALVAMIPLNSGADRWRLGASCLSAGVMAGLTYPLFAHWAWGGGWLQELGHNYGFGRGFLDCGGAAAIHSVGGLTALAIAWILGPRRGKFNAGSMPMAIPGHNAVFVVFGCFLAWVGWLGLGGAGASLFAGAGIAQVALGALNTTLGAAASALTGAALTHSRFGKIDASLTANAWIAGLVATSAGCAFMAPLASVLIGVVGGALVVFVVDWLELRLTIDDPGGAIAVHGLNGLWGLLAAGWFARFPGVTNDSGQTVAQVAGIATLIGFILPLSYALNALQNRFRPQRVALASERQGLDLSELGASAYPDLLTYNDEN
jgi:Amt family ammonium transporter